MTKFLRVPKLENIDKKIPEPYNLSTGGMIPSQKFNKIYDALLKDELPSLNFLLSGHKLQSQLEKLSKSELADFCRHVIIINKDKLGWQTADELIAELDNLYIPNWELPEFIFRSDFHDAFSSIIRWEWNSTKIAYFEKLMEQSLPYIDEEVIENKINSSYSFWSIRDLWLMLETILSLKEQDLDLDGTNDILQEIMGMFLNLVENDNVDLGKRIIVLSLLLRTSQKYNLELSINIQEYLDSLWIQVKEELSSHARDSYLYLFLINYGYLITQYRQQSPNFIFRRKLINRILNGLNRFSELSIGKWLEYFVVSTDNELVLEFVLSGYHNISKLTKDHAIELPKGENRNQMISLFSEISNVLFTQIKEYLESVSGHELTKDLDDYRLQQFLRDIPLHPRARSGVLWIFLHQFSNHVLRETEISARTIKLYTQIFDNEFDPIEANIYGVSLKILAGVYPFERKYNTIELEIKENNSLMKSQTFEKEILDFISSNMEQLLDKYKVEGDINILRFEQLLLFISEWVQYFVGDPFFQEVLMVLSPIISICMVQIIQYYYEYNMPSKAFLTYLNMSFFVEYIQHQINLLDNESSSKNRDISSEYQRITREWDLHDKLNIKQLYRRVQNLELIFANQEVADEMIDEDVIFGFADLSDHLNNVLNTIITNPDYLEPVIEMLYEPPQKDSFLYQGRIGMTNLRQNKEILKFPIFRNIHKYAAALTIFPIEINKNQLLEDDGKLDQIIKILDSSFVDMEDGEENNIV